MYAVSINVAITAFERERLIKVHLQSAVKKNKQKNQPEAVTLKGRLQVSVKHGATCNVSLCYTDR